MSEPDEAPESGADPVAMGIAVGRASAALDDDLAAYLRDQRHHMREQLKHLQLSIWEKRTGVLLRAATGIVGVAVAVVLALMLWDAAHADGMVIDSFSVPADLAAKGLTGQVVATQMLDKLTKMQNATRSVRAPRTYGNNWGDDIKVEIPDTGISVGEVYRFLRGWLGRETHVTGEVYHSGAGIVITARIGGGDNASFTGADSDLDALVQKTAEQLYRMDQPIRYGTYLGGQGRPKGEQIAFYRALVNFGPLSERSWAYNGLGNITEDPAPDAAFRFYRRGVELDPTNALVTGNLATAEKSIGHAEQSLVDTRKALSLLSNEGQGQIREDYVTSYRERLQARADSLLGDTRSAAAEYEKYIQAGQITVSTGTSTSLAEQQADEHDIDAARATLAEYAEPDAPANLRLDAIDAAELLIEIATIEEDWSGILRQATSIQPLLLKIPYRLSRYHLDAELNVALAEAKLGRVADAEARIADTPADCYQCLRMRARIAEFKGDRAGADGWFGRAVQAAPSIPMAYSEWGAAHFDRGDADGAIAKFKLANQKGPHFADPLEGWGEALMKKNQSHLALAKFAEAAKYAPNWGRLHLKWGEALVYAGKKDEAAKEFSKAATLDLTADEKSELARSHAVATNP